MKLSVRYPPPFATNGFDLLEAGPAELGKAEAEITQSEETVRIIGVAFREQPCGIGVGREEFDHRRVIAVAAEGIEKQLDMIADGEEAERGASCLLGFGRGVEHEGFS